MGKRDLYETFAVVGKAMASGRRLELLELLAQGERGVEDLAQAAGLAITSTSNHLQVLHATGLVTRQRRGTSILYRLAGDDVAALLHLLRQVGAAHLPAVEQARAAYLGEGGGKEVTREQLRERLAAGMVTLIDVRPAAEYAAGHIPGALSLPLHELLARLDELPDDRTVVAYCRGAYCVLAHEAVRLLSAHGRPALRLADGMLEWRLADLPVAA